MFLVTIMLAEEAKQKTKGGYDNMRQCAKKDRLENIKGCDKDGKEINGSAADVDIPNFLPNYGALSMNRMQRFFQKLRNL